MYGTSDAERNWGLGHTQFMIHVGFTPGQSSPCAGWGAEHELRCVVHGDDFEISGWPSDLDRFWKKINAKFESKHMGTFGLVPDDGK